MGITANVTDTITVNAMDVVMDMATVMVTDTVSMAIMNITQRINDKTEFLYIVTGHFGSACGRI